MSFPNSSKHYVISIIQKKFLQLFLDFFISLLESQKLLLNILMLII